MSKTTALLIILLVGTLTTTCFTQQWTVKYGRLPSGDNLSSDNKAYSIAAGDNGCVYVAGYTGALDVSSICLVKYGPNGDTLWTRVFPEGIQNNENKAYAVTIDHQWDIIVTGFITSETNGADIITRKYDPDGNLIWSEPFNGLGNGDDKAYAITVDSYDNIYITGFTTGYQGTDYVTIRYDSDGTRHWVTTSDGPMHSDTATSITMVGDNLVAVTGCMKSSSNNMEIVTYVYNSNTGEQARKKEYSGNSNGDSKGNAITSDNQGNVYVTGYTTGSTTGKDIAILKIDPDGNLTAIQPVDISGYDDIGNSIGLSGNGDVLVTGVTSAGDITTDNYITLSYSSDGISQWRKICNGTGDNTDIAYKMAVSTTA